MNDKCPVSGETFKEERVNHVTHLFGLILSLIGLPPLITYSILYGDFWHIASYSIFGLGLVLLYIASTYYHGCKIPERKITLQVFDHICIFVLIAASYTPFALGPLRESTGWIMLGVVWTIAGAGIALKIFAFDSSQKISLVAYLVMGWLITLSWGTLQELMSETSMTLLISGGLSYTTGVVFFLWRSLPFSHAIWHLFVLCGSICHYFAVFFLLL